MEHHPVGLVLHHGRGIQLHHLVVLDREIMSSPLAMRHLHKEPCEDALLDVGEVVRVLEVVSVRHVVVQTAQNALQLVSHVQCRRDRSVVNVVVVAPLRSRLRRHLHKRVVEVQKRDVVAGGMESIAVIVSISGTHPYSLELRRAFDN